MRDFSPGTQVKIRIGNFTAAPGVRYCNFTGLDETTTLDSTSVDVAEAAEQDKELMSEGIHGCRHRCGVRWQRNGTR